MKEFNKKTALVLLESQEDFPIDFDDAWVWLGFSTKQKALNKLKANHIEGLEFLTIGLKTSRKSKGGRPSEHIKLSTDCLKTMGMMAGTSKGREIRRYFLECEHQLKQIAQQTSATVKEVDPDVAAVLAELEKLIISIRSHSRVMHIGSHQPVDELLFKSLHTLNHNQMFAINAAIKQLEMLKLFGSVDITADVTPVDEPVTVNFLTLDNNAGVASLPPATVTQPKPTKSKQKTAKRTTANKKDTQSTRINIKIPLSQRQWLADTARQVRENSTKPVPPSARVYPQHLVGIAINLLQNSDIDILATHSDRLSQDEALATINVKISRHQHQWLSDRAKDLRDEQPQTTAPDRRIYPQQMISLAIGLLQNIEIDWQQVDDVNAIERRF